MSGSVKSFSRCRKHDIVHFNLLLHKNPTFTALRNHTTCFLLISHNPTFTWTLCFRRNFNKSHWFIFCLNNKWIFLKPWLSGPTSNSHLNPLMTWINQRVIALTGMYVPSLQAFRLKQQPGRFGTNEIDLIRFAAGVLQWNAVIVPACPRTV